jgi:uncharacterized repeat protein (TIGR02543 family)
MKVDRFLYFVSLPFLLAVFFIFRLPVIQAEIKNEDLSSKLLGRILLQVEGSGEAWYLDPVSQERFFLFRPENAFEIMSSLGLGISNYNLNSYLKEGFPSNLLGRILLDVENNGEAYYINPGNKQAYFLDRPENAFEIMSKLSLGIKNSDLEKIKINENSYTLPQNESQGNENRTLILESKQSRLMDNFSIITQVESSIFFTEGGISDKGILWSSNPSLLNLNEANRVSSGPGEGSFVSDIVGLKPNSNYYFMPYYINNKGEVFYGQVNNIGSTNSGTKTPALVTSPGVQQFSVYFNANGGTLNVSSNRLIDSGNTLTSLASPSRSGYSFTSWNTKEDGSGVDISNDFVVNRDITLFAQWVINETCSDGIKNQDETSIDCGGSVCGTCETYPYGLNNSWRFEPISVSGPSSVSVNLLSGNDASSTVLASEINDLLINLPSNDNGAIFTYAISGDDAYWDLSASFSTSSTNGLDGDWATLSLLDDGDQYGPVDRLRKIYIPATENSSWLKFSYENIDDQLHDINSISLRRFGAGLDDDYWLFLGASIVSMSIDYADMNEKIKDVYGYDPLIFNHGNSGKTVGWLDDNIQDILDSHPKAKFVAVHIGGNNVSNTRPFSTMSDYYKDDFTDSYRSVINKIKAAGKIAVPGRLTFRDYENDQPDKPGVYGGGLQENGSLPFNTEIIDPIIQELTPDFYNSDAGWGLVDLYNNILNNQELLNNDGVHPTFEGREVFRDFWKDTAFNYVYTGVKVNALTPLEFNNPLEDANDLVSAAELSQEASDIALAQDKIDELSDWPQYSSDISGLQNRLDQIVVNTALRYLIDFGYSSYPSSPNWNNISTTTTAYSSSLITDSGATSTLMITIENEFSAQTNSGYTFYDLPFSASRDGFNVRGYINDDSVLVISGLSSLKKYTISFYSTTESASTYTTDFTIGGELKSVVSTNNSDEIVIFEELIADLDGKITININTDSNYGYLNAMVIQEVEVDPSCSDGIQNQDEEGVDCGGSICGACSPDPSCSDGIQNQDEEGVDCGGSICGACQAYLIDFGHSDYQQSEGNWNNITEYQVGSYLTDIIDSDGNSSSIDLSVTTRFASKGASGVDIDTGLYPRNVVIDYFYINSGSTPSVLLFSGLNSAKTYNFSFFGSRDNSDSRNTDYTIGSETVTLNCGTNYDNTVEINNISPSAEGNVNISVQAGEGSSYGYLGAIKLIEN